VKTLAEIYSNYQGGTEGFGDKGTLHTYIELYEEFMTKRSDISLLEIGVKYGHSIAMWNEYFENSQIYGIDIELAVLDKYNSEHIYFCDATNKDKVSALFKGRKFDYIIDDGSHYVQDQMKSYDILSEYLTEDGLYFIEDINGPTNLDILTLFLTSRQAKFLVVDNRLINNRHDDIMIIVGLKQS